MSAWDSLGIFSQFSCIFKIFNPFTSFLRHLSCYGVCKWDLEIFLLMKSSDIILIPHESKCLTVNIFPWCLWKFWKHVKNLDDSLTPEYVVIWTYISLQTSELLKSNFDQFQFETFFEMLSSSNGWANSCMLNMAPKSREILMFVCLQIPKRSQTML